jgi:flagellar biogenesis protein FliO
MTSLWRLVWALPLVLGIGVAAMLLLRRFIAVDRQAGSETPRMNARGSLPLSDKTCVHLIEVDGKDYLVVESSQQAVLQSVSAAAGDKSRSPARIGPPWVRRFYQAGPR